MKGGGVVSDQRVVYSLNNATTQLNTHPARLDLSPESPPPVPDVRLI